MGNAADQLLAQAAVARAEEHQRRVRAWRRYFAILRGEGDSAELETIMCKLGVDVAMLREHVEAMSTDTKGC